MTHRRVRIVESARCPQCHGRMARFTNGQGRGWVMCVDCGAQVPDEDGLRGKWKEKEDGTDDISD